MYAVCTKSTKFDFKAPSTKSLITQLETQAAGGGAVKPTTEKVPIPERPRKRPALPKEPILKATQMLE
jgi:hypothetical protein